MDTISLLKRLTEAAGISGFETAIRDEVTAVWAPLVNEIRTDTLGSVIAVRHGTGAEPRRKLMLAGHMDEIGLMVTRIREGFLSITPVGGVDRRLLLGQPVVVHGRRDLPGVVGSRPPHLLGAAERDRLVAWDDLVVDVGLPAEEVVELVRVGDLVSFRRPLRELADGRVAAKAIDDRVSLAAITICLETLGSRAHAWDVVAVATVQEEETFAGAITTAYRLEPDIALRKRFTDHFTLTCRAHCRAYLYGQLASAPGGDVILRWHVRTWFEPIISLFAEGLLVDNPDIDDGHFVRGLFGSAFPGRMGELMVFLSVDSGNGKGLFINRVGTRVSAGVRYRPFGE